MSREENRCTICKWGHACKYKEGKCLEENPGINHQPPFLISIFSFKYLLPEREDTSSIVRFLLQERSQSYPFPSARSSPRCLRCRGLGWLADFFPSPPRASLLHVPHPPRFCLGLSETFDPEKRIGSRFGKAETNQLPF